MKIIYIQPDISLSGSSKALLNIIKYLKEENEIEVFIPTVESPLGRMLAKFGVKCISCKFGLKIYPLIKKPMKISQLLSSIREFLRNRYYDKIALKSLEKEVKIFKPDIIHTNVGPIDLGYKIARKYKIPHVWHIREYQKLDFCYHFFPNGKIFTHYIHSHYTNNICITEGIFDYFNMSSDKDKVIYDGVIDKDAVSDHSSSLQNGNNYFLYVSGILSAQKGALDAFQAFKIFSQKNIGYKLIYICKYSPKDEFYLNLQKEIIKSGLSSSVIFLGRRSTEEVYNIMHSATAFLMLSHFEGFGFTTVEAMFNRCPVIGRNTAGTKEQFDNGRKICNREIGLRVNSLEETIKAMEFVIDINNTVDINRIKEDAYKTVTKLYTLDRYVGQIYNFYQSIINKK